MKTVMATHFFTGQGIEVTYDPANVEKFADSDNLSVWEDSWGTRVKVPGGTLYPTLSRHGENHIVTRHNVFRPDPEQYEIPQAPDLSEFV